MPFDGLVSSLDTAKERNAEPEDIPIESLNIKKQKVQRLGVGVVGTEQYIQGLQNNDKTCNLCIMEMPRGEEREKETE